MDKVLNGSLTDRQLYWLNYIRACEVSGRSAIDYAVDHDINAQTMYSCKKMLVKKDNLARIRSSRFQRAQLTRIAVSHVWRVHLPSDVSVVFTGAVEA